jgi:hypothetical protein
MGFRYGDDDSSGSVTFAGPSGQIDVGDANNEGASSSAARADHQHALPAPTGPPGDVAAAGSAGASTRVALQDHTHAHTAAQHLAGGHADLTGDFAAVGAPAAAVAAHEAAADPHAQYLMEEDGLTAATHDAHDHTTALGTAVLADLSDVAATAPAPGDALVWDDVAGHWEPGTASTGSGDKVDLRGDVLGGPLFDGTDETHTFSSGQLTGSEYRTQAGVLRADASYTYNADGTLATATLRLYADDGTTVTDTVTETMGYTAGNLTTVGRNIS